MAQNVRQVEKIWLGEQERRYSCGPASLKYALCVLGFSPREAQLRKLARTTWRGTQTNHLVRAARRFGVIPKVRHFLDDEWEEARSWLHGELQQGRPAILDVDGFEHYVVAVHTLGGHVVVIDAEGGPMDGSAYARIVTCSERRLKSWWLSGDEAGEPEAFRGISLATPPDSPPGTPRPTGPRLYFSEATVRRYVKGRPWILDEYLIDCVEMAKAAAGAKGKPRRLGRVIREIARDWVIERVTHWHGARPGEIVMMKAHVEDMALAAEAMALTVPAGSTPTVAADVAAILMAMLLARQ